MADITTKYLEAALLDQKVAGEFRGKSYAFVVARHGEQYILGVAVRNERGYNPIFGKAFITKAKAYEWADGLNDHIGLDRKTANSIIASSMRP